MNCPKCNHRLYVYDTRALSWKQRYQNYICVHCGMAFQALCTLSEEPLRLTEQQIRQAVDRIKRQGRKEI